MSLEIVPIRFSEAAAFIDEHHRHHDPPAGWKFGCAVAKNGNIVGVATVGRPVSRVLDDGWTLEVNRVATDGTRNACSALYAACWRAAKALGYRKVVTYTLPSESGSSLKGAGWKCVGEAGGGSWNRKSRPRVDTAPTQRKIKWKREVSSD